MIRLDRERTAQAIHATFRGPGRLAKQRALLDLKLAGGKPQSSVWSVAKKQLRKESDGKCGYCEGKASHVAHGDVEHIRPKSDYWWLSYCYDNYVYACQICNQSFKSDNFPTNKPRMKAPNLPANPTPVQLDQLAAMLSHDPLDAVAVTKYEQASAAEQAGIPDPYVVNGEKIFKWEADDVLREVEAQPRSSSASITRSFQAAERFLGINRDELKRWRYETWDQADILAQVVATHGVPQHLRQRGEQQLKEMMSLTGEFAGMVRYLVRDVHGLAI